MILIPELETVVILVPRTGSGSLRRAIAARYPRAMMIYRHMEADGVPPGYDRWRRVGVVRHPIDRLWSLYKFLQTFDGDHDPDYIRAMRSSVDWPFEQWLLHNRMVFTSPYDSTGGMRFWPFFTVRHPLPENRKSQFIYLRPDLGTEVYRFDDIKRLAGLLRIELPRCHETPPEPTPPLAARAREYVARVFAWDLSAVGCKA